MKKNKEVCYEFQEEKLIKLGEGIDGMFQICDKERHSHLYECYDKKIKVRAEGDLTEEQFNQLITNRKEIEAWVNSLSEEELSKAITILDSPFFNKMKNAMSKMRKY